MGNKISDNTMENLMNNTIIVPPTRVVLSSAFSNRMIQGNGLVHKADISLEEAKALVSIGERTSNIEFVNAINPRHESTQALAKGLTDSECVGGFVSLNEGDLAVVIQPSASSRNDTEFNLKHFQECKFEVLQRIPLSLIGR